VRGKDKHHHVFHLQEHDANQAGWLSHLCGLSRVDQAVVRYALEQQAVAHKVVILNPAHTDSAANTRTIIGSETVRSYA